MSTSVDRLNDLGLALQSPTSRQSLAQDDFLKLMTTQLQNQDPFKPMESGEFLTQIAQFSTVTGIQSMQDSLAGLAYAMASNQTLQGASLVGHDVMVPSQFGYLTETGEIAGAVDVPFSGNVTVDIKDLSGQVVGHYDLGVQQAGTIPFAWDGLGDDGARLPEGNYQLEARVESGGQSYSLNTMALGHVQSVSLGPQGLTLNLLGLDSVALVDVRQIL